MEFQKEGLRLYKKEHQMDKDTHHTNIDRNQLNASNIASQQTNLVMTPRDETL